MGCKTEKHMMRPHAQALRRGSHALGSGSEHYKKRPRRGADLAAVLRVSLKECGARRGEPRRRGSHARPVLRPCLFPALEIRKYGPHLERDGPGRTASPRRRLLGYTHTDSPSALTVTVGAPPVTAPGFLADGLLGGTRRRHCAPRGLSHSPLATPTTPSCSPVHLLDRCSRPKGVRGRSLCLPCPSLRRVIHIAFV